MMSTGFLTFIWESYIHLEAMPNQRAIGQKLLNFPAKGKFIDEIDAGVQKSGVGDRAKFIRQAIVEKLERLGITVPPDVYAAPSRSGKGGRRKDETRALEKWPTPLVEHLAKQAKVELQHR